MKRIAISLALASLAFGAPPLWAQQEGEPEAQPPVASAPSADARIKTLEDEVRSLAEQVALLRGELSNLRNAKGAHRSYAFNKLASPRSNPTLHSK